MNNQGQSMRIGAIVHCRYSSRRLPGKALIDIAGKKALAYIIERLLKLKSVNVVVVATSSEVDDDPIADFCRRSKIECFRGAKDDVAQRLLDCAKKYNMDYFIRVCGDNILADYELMDRMAVMALKGGYNLVSNVKERTFPSGISVEVLNTKFFESMIPCFKTKEDREHVTIYLYNHESEIGKHFYLVNDICPESKILKLSLDDKNDLDFIGGIIRKMKKPHTEYLLKDIYELSR